MVTLPRKKAVVVLLAFAALVAVGMVVGCSNRRAMSVESAQRSMQMGRAQWAPTHSGSMGGARGGGGMGGVPRMATTPAPEMSAEEGPWLRPPLGALRLRPGPSHRWSSGPSPSNSG